MDNTCRRCSNQLSGKQTHYCSVRCCKLYLKSQYKKRYKDKINEYNRNYRKKIRKIKKSIVKTERLRCEKCGTDVALELHHIKPRVLGGSNDLNNLIVFCKKHHWEYEQLTRKFWS